MADALTPYAGLTKPTVGADNNTWGGILNGDLDTIDQFLRNIVPPGVSWDYRGSVAGGPPAGFLFEDGSAVSRSTYAALFLAIGVTYGPGDGATTFNLPDSRNRFSIGAGALFALASVGGAFTYNGATDGHAVTIAEMPIHPHGIADPGHNHVLSDPGHGHNVADPGHHHDIIDNGHSHAVGEGRSFVLYQPGGAFSQAGGALFGAATGVQADPNQTGIVIQPVLTGLTVAAGGSGVVINGAFTGIGGTQNNGGGAAHSHTLTTYAVTPPYLAANRIIKT